MKAPVLRESRLKRDGGPGVVLKRRVITPAIIDIIGRGMADKASVQLAAIVESSSDAIVGKDLQGNVTSWNAGAERMFGYAAGEMLGRSITRIIPMDRQSDEEKILGRIRSGESVEHFETQRLRKDGKLIDVSVSVSPIRDAEGQVVGASKVARDITERKRAEKELRTNGGALSRALRVCARRHRHRRSQGLLCRREREPVPDARFDPR